MDQPFRTDVALGSEIGFLDLWRSIARHRLLLVVLTLASLGVGLAFILFVKPVYQANAVVVVGQVGGTGLLEPVEQTMLRLESKFGQRVADGVTRERPFLVSASPIKAVPGALELAVEAYTPQEAAAFLASLVTGVQSTHQQFYEERKKILTEQLSEMHARRNGLIEQHESASALLDRMKNKDPVQASLLLVELARIASQIVELESERPKILEKLAPPQTQPTQLIGEITAPRKASYPRRLSVLALAGLLGFLAAVLIAIVMEYAGSTASARHR